MADPVIQTAVPQVAFTPAGLSVPAESDVLAGVQADMNAAFGGGLNPALNTPQGQLASSTAAIIGDSNDTFAEFVSQIDPDTNDGAMQDAIARIYFLDRSPGAPTVVQCQCVGALGTVIPVGAQAQDTSGNLYTCTDGGSIPVGGSITLTFANIQNGPIPCPANTLTTIYQAIPGWDTINNSSAGIVGQNVETAAEFRQRRQLSVALNAHGSLPSIRAAVADLADVIAVYATENDSDNTVNTGPTNYPLLPHSLYVAAVGASDDAVAVAIWNKKDVGCNYNGNTSVTVTDPNYAPPQPSYVVKFERPAALPIKFAVQIQSSPALPANIVVLVQNAIIAAFNGTDGVSTRVIMGGQLVASRFYGPVQLIGNEVSTLSILLGSSTPTLTALLIGIDQFPTVQASDISVTLV